MFYIGREDSCNVMFRRDIKDIGCLNDFMDSYSYLLENNKLLFISSDVLERTDKIYNDALNNNRFSQCCDLKEVSSAMKNYLNACNNYKTITNNYLDNVDMCFNSVCELEDKNFFDKFIYDKKGLGRNKSVYGTFLESILINERLLIGDYYQDFVKYFEQLEDTDDCLLIKNENDRLLTRYELVKLQYEIAKRCDGLNEFDIYRLDDNTNKLYSQVCLDNGSSNVDINKFNIKVNNNEINNLLEKYFNIASSYISNNKNNNSHK